MKVPCGGFIFNDDEFVLNDQGEVQLGGGVEALANIADAYDPETAVGMAFGINADGDIDLIEAGGGGGTQEVKYVANVASDETSETGYFLEYLGGESYETILNYAVPLVEVNGLTCYYYQETSDETEEKSGIMFAGFGSGPTAGYVTIWEDDTVTVDVYSLGGGGDTVTTSALSGDFTYTNGTTGIVLSNTTTYPCLEEAMNAFNDGAETVKIPLGELTPSVGDGTPFTINGNPLTYYGISASTSTLSCSSNGGKVVFDSPFVMLPGENVTTAYAEATVNMFSGNPEVPIIPTTWKLSFTVGANNVLSSPKLNIYAAFDTRED